MSHELFKEKMELQLANLPLHCTTIPGLHIADALTMQSNRKKLKHQSRPKRARLSLQKQHDHQVGHLMGCWSRSS